MNPESIKYTTQVIALSALAVGSLVAGRRYYASYKLNKTIIEAKNEIENRYLNCFIIDRLIDADCAGKVLRIGVNSNKTQNNILSNQGIRWGEDGQIKRLISFNKVNGDLIYDFEDNYRLILSKNNKNKIIYSFLTDDNIIVKEIDDKVLNYWKTISMASSELDRIVELK